MFFSGSIIADSGSGLAPLARRRARSGSSLVKTKKMIAITSSAAAQISATVFHP